MGVNVPDHLQTAVATWLDLESRAGDTSERVHRKIEDGVEVAKRKKRKVN